MTSIPPNGDTILPSIELSTSTPNASDLPTAQPSKRTRDIEKEEDTPSERPNKKQRSIYQEPTKTIEQANSEPDLVNTDRSLRTKLNPAVDDGPATKISKQTSNTRHQSPSQSTQHISGHDGNTSESESEHGSEDEDNIDSDFGGGPGSEHEEDEDESETQAEHDTATITEDMKVLPTQLENWRNAGTLSYHGQLIKELCYDNDPNMVGDPEANVGISDEAEEDIETGAHTVSDETDNMELTAAVETDAVTGAMQAAVDLEPDQLMHLTREGLQEMCECFQIDMAEAEKHNGLFQLPGHNRKLKVYQLYGAYHVLKRESTGNEYTQGPAYTTIQADEPGFGKSASAATIIYLNALLEDAWGAVNKCRKSKKPEVQARHLRAPDSSYTQPPNAKCPSQESMPIMCPCVAAGPTSKLRPSSGAVVFVVPNPLLINSVEEWFKQIDMDNNDFVFQIHVQTTRMKGKNLQTARLQMGKQEELTQVNIANYLMDRRAADELYRQFRDEGLSKLSRHIFFVTPEAYKSHMKATRIHGRIPCGRYIRDEFHQRTGIGNGELKMARELVVHRALCKPRQVPAIVQMSGTPVRLGAKDLEGISSLWTLCALLAHNNHELPKTMPLKSLDDSAGWRVADKYLRSSFWREASPWGLSIMGTDWNKSSQEMSNR